MRYHLHAIDLDVIRTDGETQVRDLDEAWVKELAGLYEEDHEIAPVLVVIDPEGNRWLVDGFHRLEAMRRLGWTTVKADVRQGPTATLDFAKMLAAEANKHGRPLKDGEKRKAVLMARGTPDGARMGVRELARHCGVTVSYVSEILGGCSVVNTPVSSNRSAASTATQARIHGDLRARVDALIKANPDRDSKEIAAEAGCGEKVVYDRRAVLGLLKPKKNGRAAAEGLLRKHPDWTNARIAGEAGSSPETVAKLREEAGLPSRRRGPPPKEAPPTAPARKGGDARDDAEVIHLRPSGDQPKAPPFAYSGTEKGIAKQVLYHLRIAREGFRRPAWARLMNEIDEIARVRDGAA